MEVSGVSSVMYYSSGELDETPDPEPTDYSQRYGEQPVDDFVCPRGNRHNTASNAVMDAHNAGCEDSLCVYRTEGTPLETPLETPLNFSLASSLTDLPSLNTDTALTTAHANTGHSGVECAARKPIPPPKPKALARRLNPKPTERLSQTSGKTAIQNATQSSQITTQSIAHTDPHTDPHTDLHIDPHSDPHSDPNAINSMSAMAGKASVAQTPLMYSRSSSLGSLSSLEVKSLTCQSSVVSEFSHRPSQAVSPSDLPDSPFQSPPSSRPTSRPSSPKAHSFLAKVDDNESEDDEEVILRKCIESAMPSGKCYAKSGVSPVMPKTTPNVSPNHSLSERCDPIGCEGASSANGDQMRPFYVEDTPVVLSQCHSSLSSLSLEDEDDELENEKLLKAAINSGMKMHCQTNAGANKAGSGRPEPQTGKCCHNDRNERNDKRNDQNHDEDEKTYTICRQSQSDSYGRKNVYRVTDETGVEMVDSMTDSCLSDLDATKPPSMMNSVMMSSTDSFSSAHNRNRIPVPKPRDSKLLSANKCDDKQSLLDNTKPPSLMDDISMSQSIDLSISSDISDISLDFSDSFGQSLHTKSNENVAKAAMTCARDLKLLTKSCVNGQTNADKDRKPSNSRVLMEYDFDVSDSEVSEELPVDSEHVVVTVADKENCFDTNSLTSSSAATVLAVESRADRADRSPSEPDFEATPNWKLTNEERQRLVETSIRRIRENAKIVADTLKDMELLFALNDRRMSPIGCEDLLADERLSYSSYVGDDESDVDSHATYKVNNHPLRATIVRPVARKTRSADRCADRQALPQMSTCNSHSYLNTNCYLSPSTTGTCESPNASAFKPHRCVVKATRTSALRASRSRSVDNHFNGLLESQNELLMCAQQSRDKSYDRECSANDKKRANADCGEESIGVNRLGISKSRSLTKNLSLARDEKTSKKSDKTSLLWSVRSKLSASLSSHNLGASNVSLSSSSSNGLTPVTCSSLTRKLEVQSRIASLWKRSKSSPNQKADQKSEHNTDQNTDRWSTSADKNNLIKSIDFSRSLVSRRSFGKQSKAASKLIRSSTFEKLPQSADEANNVANNVANNAVNNALNKEVNRADDNYSKKCNNWIQNNNNYNKHKVINKNVNQRKHNTSGRQNYDQLNSNVSSVSTSVSTSGEYVDKNSNSDRDRGGKTMERSSHRSVITNAKSAPKAIPNGHRVDSKTSRRTILVTAV